MSDGNIASTSYSQSMQNGNQDDSDPIPIKKRTALKPHEQQAAQLAKLLANPEKPINLPAPSKQEKTLRPPREIMKNVSGSSAGAGSGEFHIYKHSRRREYERIKLMEEAHAREIEKKEFEKRQRESQSATEQKTNKNRAKRDKKKAAKLAAKGGKKVTLTKEDAEKADEDDDTEPSGKRRRINAEGTSNVIFQPRNSSDHDDDDDDET